ncbi:MAG: type II secretion system F family protein [Chromatiales bacterium]|nr:type II secretion system F family protein [Chromatiales bacterium]
MARFQYRAIGTDGEIRDGELEGVSENDAVEQINRMGLLPLEVGRSTQSAGGRKSHRRLFSKERIRRADLVHLTGELATLLDAGLPLDRALGVLVDTSENSAVVAMIEELRAGIQSGHSFSEALESREELFGRLYLNMVRAGEAGGALDLVLARLADYMEKAQELRRSVSSALIYPAILLGVAVLSVIVLLVFVVPQFAQMFEDMGQALPTPTRVVMLAGDLFRDYGWLMAIGLAILVWGLKRLFRDEGRRRWLDARLLSLPMVGDLIAKIETARFSRTLGTLMENGVHLLQAMQIAAGTLSNRVLAEEVERAELSLREGAGLAETLVEGRRFPPFALHMMQVGEESGKLERMLLKVASVYDGEVQAAIKRLLALAEPVIILGLGAVIAGIIMSILVAILGVNELAF